METRKAICQRCGIEFEYEYKGGGPRKYCTLNCQRLEQRTRYNFKHRDKVAEHSHRGYLATAISCLYGGKCAICGWCADKTRPAEWHTGNGNEVHHIIPVKDGGKANYDNLILLCPNHHKQAHMGIVTQEQLKHYLVKPPTKDELQEMSNKSVDRVAKAIFEEPAQDNGRIHYTEEQKREIYKKLGWQE